MKAKVKTWLRNVENGNIRNFTEKVLNEVKKNTQNPNIDNDGFSLIAFKKGISTYELRETLGISHQTLTSCLSVLHDEGLIKDVSQVEINDSTYSVYMFIHDLSYRNHINISRKEEKCLQWLKNATKFDNMLSEPLRILLMNELNYKTRDKI